jgi:hypothetical protein
LGAGAGSDGKLYGLNWRVILIAVIRRLREHVEFLAVMAMQ